MHIVTIFSIVIALFGACKKEEPEKQGASYLELTVQGSQRYQRVHGFGASDAWSCQFIGKNWPASKKQQMADWLFSNELDENNNPKGIGLNTWRFNIGAGSAQQFGSSGINDEWRRAESFLTAQNTYDWSLQEGQRWFLKAAKQRGADHFIGFVNSPPVQFTKNGKAFSSSSSSYNLPEENYASFANYLADVAEKLYENDGVELKYISPFNEPQWDWTDGGQEGTPAKNSEIAAVTKVINQTFANRNLNTSIELPEAAQLEYLYKDHNRPGRGNQLNEFFNPVSENYLGNLSHLAPKVAGHSYYSTWPLSSFVEIRNDLANALNTNPSPIEFWMTEYCVLENNNEISGNGRDLGMETALYTARVIFADLVLAHASSWQWWLAISPYDYKDGLIYTDYNKTDGNYYDSKNLWALGNFSRFIKAEMQRVNVTRSDFRTIEQSLDGLMATAFISNDELRFTLVLINYSAQSIPLKLNFNELGSFANLKLYLTNAALANNLAFKGSFDPQQVFDMPARSVVTISNQP